LEIISVVVAIILATVLRRSSTTLAPGRASRAQREGATTAKHEAKLASAKAQVEVQAARIRELKARKK
jgi:hypothetical protein